MPNGISHHPGWMVKQGSLVAHNWIPDCGTSAATEPPWRSDFCNLMPSYADGGTIVAFKRSSNQPCALIPTPPVPSRQQPGCSDRNRGKVLHRHSDPLKNCCAQWTNSPSCRVREERIANLCQPTDPDKPARTKGWVPVFGEHRGHFPTQPDCLTLDDAPNNNLS